MCAPDPDILTLIDARVPSQKTSDLCPQFRGVIPFGLKSVHHQACVVDKVFHCSTSFKESVHLAGYDATFSLRGKDRLQIWVSDHLNVRVLVIKTLVIYGGNASTTSVLTYLKVHVRDSLTVCRQN